MNLKTIWNSQDFWRAMLWAGIVINVWATIHPYFDPDFAKYPIEPYGVLWYVLNPLFQNWQTYSWQITAFWLVAVAVQYRLVKKGKLSNELFVLNMISVAFVRTLFIVGPAATVVAAQQDTTVIMFAPLASINPLFTLLLLAQKVAVGWSWNLSDPHWALWLAQIHNNPWTPPYVVILFWMIYPNLIWLKGNRKFIFRVLNILHLHGFAIGFLRRTGLYERKVVRLMKQQHGRLFVDIGSNSGFYSKLCYPNFEHVASFDPNPRYPGYKVALSDRRGTAMLYLNSNVGSGDTLLPDFTFRGVRYSTRKMIKVATARFDEIFEEADFVKIDVEGAEFLVLEGMANSKVKKILVELHDLSRVGELIALLRGRGYSTEKVDKDHFFAWKFQ